MHPVPLVETTNTKVNARLIDPVPPNYWNGLPEGEK